MTHQGKRQTHRALIKALTNHLLVMSLYKKRELVHPLRNMSHFLSTELILQK